MARLDRYRIDIPRELSEIRTQPWLSEGSLTCDPYHHKGPIFNCAPTQFHHQCSCFHIINGMLEIECYLWASNHQPFDYWRAHHVYNVASQPRTSDRLPCHWRALCLLAYDNWRCSIQPENFSLIKSAEPEPGFDLGSTAGESSTLTTRLQVLYTCTPATCPINNSPTNFIYNFIKHILHCKDIILAPPHPLS